MRKILILILALLLCLRITAQTQLSNIINEYASVVAIDYCNNALTVVDATGFLPSMNIILIQMKGAIISENDNAGYGDIQDLRSAGAYERSRILSVNGNEIILENALFHSYNLDGVVQIVSLPNYENAEVVGTIEPAPWNGTFGGVLALEVNNTLTLSGTINADGQGFRGGFANIAQANNCNFLTNANDYFYGLNNWRGAAKGEGIAATTTGREAGRGAQSTGGGGGNDHNSGGGGGANITSGGNGGRNEEPLILGCDGNFPGIGGKAIPSMPTRIFMGGGGGAGHENNDVATNGTPGGGIIIIIAKNINGNAQNITARGRSLIDDATGDGAGGAGAGGTVVIDAENITSRLNILVNGGDGGDVNNSLQNRCHGPGGGGAGGRILVSTNDNITTNVLGGAAGISRRSTNPFCQNSTNGSQPGSPGLVEMLAFIPQGSGSIPDPTILTQPQDVNTCFGQPAVITSLAGGFDLQYQWQINRGTGFENLTDNADFIGTKTNTLTINTSLPDFATTFFRLQISNTCNNQPVHSDPVQVTFSPPPSAQFGFTITDRDAQFTNTSTNTDSYIWNFGDGNTSTQTTPTHTYAADGVYEVTLSAISNCDTVVTTQTVTIQTQPTANFSADITEACAPFSVSFVNNSSENSTTFRWIFPGGNPLMSTDRNPMIAYATPGIYNVILIAANEFGADTTSLVQYIRVNPLPTADFSATANGLLANFTNTSMNADQYFWSFGDSNTSTEANPIHSYPADGDYQVTLTAINACDSVVTQQTIRILNLPTAAFSANITEGCAPLSVNFQNNSSDNATNFTWILAGSQPALSNATSPSVTYPNAGSYDVTLIATNELGSDTLFLPNYIQVNPFPNADFSAIETGLSVNFINTSANGDRYFWDFGDGNTSSEVSPTHLYTADGSYTVTLSVVNSCDSVSTTQNIVLSTRPVAAFAANMTEGCAPFNVSFTNNSSASSTSFLWILPGATPNISTDQNPMVTYNAAGIYDVTLIAINEVGRDTTQLQNYIMINPNPTADFVATANDLRISVTNNATNADTYLWDFGDGNTSNAANPSHLYAMPGRYTIFLTARNDCGEATVSQTINVGAVPTALFTVDRQNGCAPHLVNFRNTSRGTYESIIWEFPGGDPLLSTDPNPTVRYFTPGQYDVKLIINGMLGSDTIVQSNFINVLEPPTAAFDFTMNGNTLNFISQITNATELSWNFGDGSMSNEANPMHTFPASGVYNVTLNASNAFCSRSVTRTIAISLTSVEDLRASGIEVFPNPTDNELFIRTLSHHKTIQFQLYTTSGQLMKKGQFTKNISIDLTAFAEGLYLLQLQQGARIWVAKIIKK